MHANLKPKIEKFLQDKKVSKIEDLDFLQI